MRMTDKGSNNPVPISPQVPLMELDYPVSRYSLRLQSATAARHAALAY